MTKNILGLAAVCASAILAQTALTITTPNGLPVATVGQAYSVQLTATGGAWNASIVAEVASWGKDKLVADGLGAYIAQVTEKGDQPAIYFSIMVMALFVVVINRVLWRRLYDLAERKFKLD